MSHQSTASIETYLTRVTIPAIPEVAVQLLKTLEDDDFHIATLAGIIERDPGITASVLKQANSAHFGMPMRVETVADALRVIGLKAVRSIALAASVANSFTFPSELSKETFWKSCELTAEFSQKIAAKTRCDKYAAWLVGFILRVGELMIAQIEPTSIRIIEQTPVHPGARWQREKTIFGLTEGAFVSALADKWNFPTRIVNSLKNVALPVAEDIAFFEEAGAVHIGALLSDLQLAGVSDVDTVTSHMPTLVLEALGLQIATIHEIYSS